MAASQESNTLRSIRRGATLPVADTALLLIDVINDLEFEGGAADRTRLPMARRLAALKRRAGARRRPGDLRQRQLRPLAVGLRRTVEHCTAGSSPGRGVAAPAPEEDDYFVLKPKHSGFYATTLDMLLTT